MCVNLVSDGTAFGQPIAPAWFELAGSLLFIKDVLHSAVGGCRGGTYQTLGTRPKFRFPVHTWNPMVFQKQS